MLAAGCCVLWYSWNSWTFDRQCLTTAGQLTGDSYTKNTTHGIFTSSSTYDVAYKYQVNGSDYTGQDSIQTDPATMQSVTVYYNPAEPGKSSLDNRGWVTPFEMGAGMAVIAIGIIIRFIMGTVATKA